MRMMPEDHLLAAAEGRLHDVQLLGRCARVGCALLLRERLLLKHVAAQQAACRQEGQAHRPGGEAKHHGEVAVVLPFDASGFHGAPPARPNSPERFIGFIGQFDSLDPSVPDQDVPVASRRMPKEVEVLAAEADQLVDEGHRVALRSEAAERERGAVGNEGNRLRQVDELAGHGSS
jgi:hypothetical protein